MVVIVNTNPSVCSQSCPQSRLVTQCGLRFKRLASPYWGSETVSFGKFEGKQPSLKI